MGLEELQKVLPGGDTYMHEGFERVTRCMLSASKLCPGAPWDLVNGSQGGEWGCSPFLGTIGTLKCWHSM